MLSCFLKWFVILTQVNALFDETKICYFLTSDGISIIYIDVWKL